VNEKICGDSFFCRYDHCCLFYVLTVVALVLNQAVMISYLSKIYGLNLYGELARGLQIKLFNRHVLHLLFVL